MNDARTPFVGYGIRWPGISWHSIETNYLSVAENELHWSRWTWIAAKVVEFCDVPRRFTFFLWLRNCSLPVLGAPLRDRRKFDVADFERHCITPIHKWLTSGRALFLKTLALTKQIMLTPARLELLAEREREEVHVGKYQLARVC
jgi:hypothetical protein